MIYSNKCLECRQSGRHTEDCSQRHRKCYPSLIGSMLRQVRLAAGISQTDIAKTIKVDQSTVSRIENGKGDYPIALLSEFAKACGSELHINVK